MSQEPVHASRTHTIQDYLLHATFFKYKQDVTFKLWAHIRSQAQWLHLESHVKVTMCLLNVTDSNYLTYDLH